MARDPISIYEALQKLFSKDVKGNSNAEQIVEVASRSIERLKPLKLVQLKSLVGGKKYFAFSKGKKFSRAVNSSLYSDDIARFPNLIESISQKAPTRFTPEAVTKLIYSAAIAFCCFVDLTRDGDQKTPGTYFEYLIGHLFARRLGINPTRSLPVLNMDMKATLPTDFVFNLGSEKAKYHLPVKTSTRERIIQVWAHQRVLDGVYGTGRFIGTPVILAETKSDRRKKEVIEICLPDQWRLYQMHIAQLKRIYYLDVPLSYDRLNTVFPPISVRPFGEFFFEADSLGGGAS